MDDGVGHAQPSREIVAASPSREWLLGIPAFTLAARESTSRLRELVLLGIVMPDLSLLPPALISLAYGGPTFETKVVFTFRDLRTIFRTCPALKNLWLCVDWRGSAAELHNTAPTTVQLHQLGLRIISNATVTQHLLNFMTSRNIRHVDVCHFEGDPVHDLLPNFQGQSISILPTTMYWGMDDCDIVVTDPNARSRYIRGADFEHIRTYPLLWSSLVSLTICGDMSNRLERRPPHAPCLQRLRLLYHPISDRRAIRRTISTIEPWKLANGGWQCPNLHTVEFALVLSRSPYARPEKLIRPLLLPSSAVLKFVTGELSHSPITHVIVYGDNIRIESEADEELPFTLSCDTSDSGIQVLWTDMVFDGFDS
ncbi:hypothetical protein EXIGLDRAFT_777074 [Exidia glandulosa HHB12029]|uniref:F-box domain-containing protein n=1 Tax=Exidia glandulosa HHB12029 TaxID=1314781 RepID=A0A165D7H1_EXIGL|nr:hypothetical protein EXIGLDRAFT_777074 [Exidia glandulosa HHB12029]